MSFGIIFSVITILCAYPAGSAVIDVAQESTFYNNRIGEFLEDQKQHGNSAKLWSNVELHFLDGFVMPVIPPLSNWSSEAERTYLHKRSQMSEKEEKEMSGRFVTDEGSSVWPVMCGLYNVLPETDIYISTPNYPDQYSMMISCDWTLMTEQGYGFAIECPVFSIASEDGLEVTKGNDRNCISRYEGTQGPVHEEFNSSLIEISFLSHYWATEQGFVCKITAKEILPPTTTTTTTTTTTVPTTPDPSLSDPLCGIATFKGQKIINGQAADLHEYPWQVYLRILWADKPPQVCGGSLINHNWIITAGHCVLRLDVARETVTPTVVAYLGMQNRTSPFEDGGVSIYADEIVVHPELSFSYDVALIRLVDPVEFSDSILPICLPLEPMPDLSGAEMFIVGWGRTETGSLSIELREMPTYGIVPEECRKVFGNFITDHHFCTESINGSHICLGDSGGPVLNVVDGRFFLRGVVSFVATQDCSGDFPDGHSDVEFFMPWIRNVTQFDQP